MILQYWKILFPVFIITGIYYFYLMMIKRKAILNYYNGDHLLPIGSRIGIDPRPHWTYETRHDWLNDMKWYFKIPLAIQIIVFLILDWLLNILLTVPMLDKPATFFELTTHRMKRYKKMLREYYGKQHKVNDMIFMDRYHYKFAVFICKLLNRGEFNHC